jgi:citrate lyase subunit beta/citryl-CoA lyase
VEVNVSQLNKPRSYLFVPANRSDFIAKAHLKGADVIVLDLEDSVPQNLKAEVRKELSSAIQYLKEQHQVIAVRINSDLENLSADLAAVDLALVDCLLLPKAEDASVINFITAYLAQLEERQNCVIGSTYLVPMIETCRGVLNMREIANATPRIIALALGSEDLASELGVPPTTESLINVCQQMVLAAGEAGIAALGFPGSIGEFGNREKLSQLLSNAKGLGFSGALCVHPVQVCEANLVFVFSEEQQEWAARVIDAMDTAEQKGQGVCEIDGRMIDAPVVALAHKILAQSTI